MPSTAPSRSDRPAASDVAVRAVVATVGAYAVAYLLTAALAGICLRGLSMDRVDAAILSSSVGLLVLPAVSIWAFAERRLAWVVLGPAAASVLLAGAVWALRV